MQHSTAYALTCSSFVAGLLLLSACGDPEVTRLERVRTFMTAELEPPSDIIWDNAGFILTYEGEENIFPANDEEWTAMIDAANELKRIAEEMKDPAYAGDDPAWGVTADGLIATGDLLIESASAQDEQAFFDAGGQLYRVCVSCHQRYNMKSVE